MWQAQRTLACMPLGLRMMRYGAGMAAKKKPRCSTAGLCWHATRSWWHDLGQGARWRAGKEATAGA